MLYCSKGEKATVNYTFGTSKQGSFVTEETPIEVTAYTKRINASPNFSESGFRVRFASPNARPGTLPSFIVYDYEIVNLPRPDYDVPTFLYWFCGHSDWNRNFATGQREGPGIYPGTLEIISSEACPQPKLNRCSIEVKHNGKILFQDQGDCNCNYSVQCGDCPEGHLRCDSTGYPGYCCIPCSEIKSEIRNLTSIVKSINNG